jgi:hypothetical protein
MGLGKKLGQLNQANDKDLKGNPSAVERGYTAQNLGLPQMASMTPSEMRDVKETRTETAREIGNVTVLGDLKMPTVPMSSDQDQQKINELVVAKMWRIICLRKLQNFYTQDSLQTLVNRACLHDYRLLMQRWGLPTLDMATDLAVLGLYDIVLFGDDSYSMSSTEPSEDNMSRWDLLREVLKTVSFWATLMDSDGVVVRFFNSILADEGNGVSTTAQVDGLFNKIRPSREKTTPMGKELKTKILDQFVYPMLERKQLTRPILIITMTDGIPDSRPDVINAIRECYSITSKSYYGCHAVAFSFAQIGSDTEATKWLGEIDTDKEIGKLIDCTSEFTIEKEECEKQYSGISFTPPTWIVKLMIGAVDPSYDKADENSSSSVLTPEPK